MLVRCLFCIIWYWCGMFYGIFDVVFVLCSCDSLVLLLLFDICYVLIVYKDLKYRFDNFVDCCVRDLLQFYFYYYVLQILINIEDGGIGLNGKFVGCLVFVWVIIYLCVVKGIKLSGKVCIE